MFDAILFDLDDTLFPQAEFLDQAWARVCLTGAEDGLDPVALHGALTATGRITDALALLGVDARHAPRLLYAFRGFWPQNLTPYPGVDDRLEALAGEFPLALVVDGNPAQQRAKLQATGLVRHFRAVVCTDEVGGRAFRKPHTSGFRRALSALRVPAGRAVMIGDRPDRDVAGATALGIRAIRVRQGAHRLEPDHPATWRSAETILDAVDLVATRRPAGDSRRAFV